MAGIGEVEARYTGADVRPVATTVDRVDLQIVADEFDTEGESRLELDRLR